MDLSKLLASPEGHDPYDLFSLQEENDRLRRLLAGTARSYNTMKREFDVVREASGHNMTPFRFFDLPREVRDLIYLFAFGTQYVNPEPRPMAWLAFDYPQMKPRSPSLCLANKQTYREGVQILYSKSVFRFERPGHLLQFEEQIGSCNRDLVRRIEIITSGDPARSCLMIDPQLVAPCDYQAIPSHWAKALSKSKLNHITEMMITNYTSQKWAATPVEVLAKSLIQAVERTFVRNKLPTFTPRLTLNGFEEGADGKFPSQWKIRTVGAFARPENTDFANVPSNEIIHHKVLLGEEIPEV